MAVTLNATHDPTRRSWIASAEREATDFPVQNLPFGVFRAAPGAPTRIGVAIGDSILDLAAAVRSDLVPSTLRDYCGAPDLNRLMAAGTSAWSALRWALSELLGADTCPPAARARATACLVSPRAAEMLLPARIGDYTDFYASIHHATRVGAMFRPDQPLSPNYKWVPIGYHGRSSSIVPSGTVVRRPTGQIRAASGCAPEFAPTRQLDYELELGWFVGSGNEQGTAISIGSAADHLFGAVLLNDWSARDIQAWEYQPLGPFLAKSFGTSISPWVVTTEALAPFRTAPTPRAPGDPAPLSYLDDKTDKTSGAFDITLEVSLATQRMRTAGHASHGVCRSNAATLYWTPAQLVAHHTSNGCNLRPGDLLATGTISGPTLDACGCLLELTRRGSEPLSLPDGETREFLEDGDEVVLRGFAARPGYRRIGWAECRGVVGAAS